MKILYSWLCKPEKQKEKNILRDVVYVGLHLFDQCLNIGDSNNRKVVFLGKSQ